MVPTNRRRSILTSSEGLALLIVLNLHPWIEGLASDFNLHLTEPLSYLIEQ
jgi:hypothetical protein